MALLALCKHAHGNAAVAIIPWVLMCAIHGAGSFRRWPHLLWGILRLKTLQKKNWSCIGG